MKAENDAASYALYFGKKYGLVMGQGDLAVDFDCLTKSRSKLGTTYEVSAVK